MDSSEKKTFIIAIIIVIIGTLVITAGFTIGLLFLTEPDSRTITEGKLSFDIDLASPDLSGDMQIDDDDFMISEDISSIDENIPKVSFDIRYVEYIEENTEEDPEDAAASFDISERTPRADRDLINSRSIGRRAGNRWLIIDKSKFSLTLNNRSGVLREWGIAVGSGTGDKQHKGDNRTPIGTFRISHIQDSSKWTHDFRDGKGEIRGAYGPWFIRLFTPPWTGIGIHGTHDPDSIGERASEGCIRMNNEDVSELRRLVRVGMAVIIVE